MNRLISILLLALTVFTARAQTTVTWVTNATGLASLPPASTRQVVAVGNDVAGWSMWHWNSASVASTNSSTVKYSGLTSGRWIQSQISEMVNVTRKTTTVATMQAMTGLADGAIVNTLGRLSVGDGGAGKYFYLSASDSATNRGTIFEATGMGAGRFLLLGDPADIRLWGALAGVSDSTPAIQAAIDALTATTFGGASKPRIFIPGYQYHVYSTITVTNPVLIDGLAIEANSVNTAAYSLNGSTLVSHITNGSPIIHVSGTDVGEGLAIIQGIEIQNIGIDGSTDDGDGIWFDCNYNISDVRLRNLVIRNVGGSAIRSGDGTRTGSPRWGYSRFEKITAISPGRDGFELLSQNNSTVAMVFDSLYVNGAGRSSFHFVNLGGRFEANNLVENNAAQLESGYGMHLQNCDSGHFKGLYLEGDGRTQSSGDSLDPLFSSAALLLEGSSKIQFDNPHFTSPSGYLTNFAAGALVHIKSSVATNGFTARDSSGNTFNNATLTSYIYGGGSATATAVGSGGSLGAGVYSYRVTSVYTNATGYWETPLAAADAANVRTVANGSVILTNIPVSDTTLGTLVGRKIWRTAADGATYKLLLSTTNNVSTYSLQDTIADGSLSTNAVFSPLVLIESGNGQNRFEDTAFTASPLIVNNGPQNEFVNSRVLTVDPSFQPFKGASSFSSTAAYPNAARFFWGSDSTGLLNGNGITRYQNKRVDLLMPGYSSRAFGDESVGFMSVTADAGTNRLTIGGNGTDYGLTEVVVNTTSVSGTATNRQARIDSTGVFVDNALGAGGVATLTNNVIVGGTLVVTNAATLKGAFGVTGAATLSDTLAVIGAATLSGILNVAGVARHAADIVLPSGGALRGTNSVSGLAEILAYISGSTISFGPNSGTGFIEITPGTGGLRIGSAGSAGNIAIKRPAFATAGATLKDSRETDIEAAYWNGSASTTVNVTPRVSMDSVTPTYSYRLKFGSTDRYTFRDDGMGIATWGGGGTAPTCTGATMGSGSKNNAGFVTTSTTGTTTCVVTFSVTAPTGWSIAPQNTTTANLIRQTGSTATTATFAGTTVSGDVITYIATPY